MFIRAHIYYVWNIYGNICFHFVCVCVCVCVFTHLGVELLGQIVQNVFHSDCTIYTPISNVGELHVFHVNTILKKPLRCPLKHLKVNLCLCFPPL